MCVFERVTQTHIHTHKMTGKGRVSGKMHKKLKSRIFQFGDEMNGKTLLTPRRSVHTWH